MTNGQTNGPVNPAAAEMPALIEKDQPLAELNSWKVGGAAELFAAPSSIDELQQVYDWALASHTAVTVLSSGTNVLISDEGIVGLTVMMRDLHGVEYSVDKSADSSVLNLSGWAGSSKAEALKIFLKHKLSPALFLTGLPGDLGAGVVMNAGVSEERVPREFCEIVSWIEVLRPVDPSSGKGGSKVVRIEASDIDWSYRKSNGWQPGIITKVGMQWPLDQEDPEIMNKIKQATRSRIMKQPIDKPSCGSTFRNPEGEFSAGALIDQCGLKEYRVGGAYVSPKHANFIVTEPGAKASDVHQVIEDVRTKVFADKGVKLHTEVVYLGAF